MFNLSEYEGLARTTYKLDPAGVDAGWPASVAYTEGQGDVRHSRTQTKRGGYIELFAGGEGSVAGIELPIYFGRAAGSLTAVVVRAKHLTYSGLRPTVRVEMTQKNVTTPRRYGVILEETAASSVVENGGVEEKTTIMSGNMTQVDDGHVGFVVDFPKRTMQSVVGYSPVFNDLPSTGGVYSIRISNESKTSPAYYNHTLGVGIVEVTLIWGRPGDESFVQLGQSSEPVHCLALNPQSVTIPAGNSLPDGRDQNITWAGAVGERLGWSYDSGSGAYTLCAGRWDISSQILVSSSGEGVVEFKAVTTSGALLGFSRATVSPGGETTLSLSLLARLTSGQQVRFVLNSKVDGDVVVSGVTRSGNVRMVRVAPLEVRP